MLENNDVRLAAQGHGPWNPASFPIIKDEELLKWAAGNRWQAWLRNSPSVSGLFLSKVQVKINAKRSQLESRFQVNLAALFPYGKKLVFTVWGCVMQTLRSIVSTFVNIIYNVYCFTQGKFDSIVQKCDVDLCGRGCVLVIVYQLLNVSHIPKARVVHFTLKMLVVLWHQIQLFNILTVLNSVHSIAL